MALEPGLAPGSPESSGRESPIPRQWRNQLGVEDAPKDKAFRKYASGVERTLALFETALQEWADYISFLNRLLKALQARPNNITTVPSKSLVAKRLSQCLNPSLPSGVHQKTLEVYQYVFTMIGNEGLSRDLPLYFPGLASTLSFASLSVRSPFLELLESHFLDLAPRSLRPAMKSIVLALLPGLEDETAEDFEQTLKLVERFKTAIRPPNSKEITRIHFSGDSFFWQCFFLASITSQSRRAGALAYLVRNLPNLGQLLSLEAGAPKSKEDPKTAQLAQMVTSPEPGLLLRCFAAGLGDENLLVQRGYLDLLVSHVPLHSNVLQVRVKPTDLELLLRAAAGVVTRREMSLNRRLWAWLLGPEPTGASLEGENGLESPYSISDNHAGGMGGKTGYFEEYGLQALSRSLLAMIKTSEEGGPIERARPYRICLSLMDRWEIGGLVVPELFLPIVDSVRKYKTTALSKPDFSEVLRSASVFFDGVESGLIFGELLALIASAIGPGNTTAAERADKMALVRFVLSHFNVREEEMVTTHAPLTALSILCMLEDAKERAKSDSPFEEDKNLTSQALGIATDLIDLVPERAFSVSVGKSPERAASKSATDASTLGMLKKIKDFYVNEQGSLEVSPAPFTPQRTGELLLGKACSLNCEALHTESQRAALGIKSRMLLLLLNKTSSKTSFDVNNLLISMHDRLSSRTPLDFIAFSSILVLSTTLLSSERIPELELSKIIPELVRHAWTYLSSPEPKYHVETARSLWQLQTALGPHNRDVEAAISSLMTNKENTETPTSPVTDYGRAFAVLWTHTIQDTASERKTPRTPRLHGDTKVYKPRLAGAEYYHVMLTRPLFLVLDALLDEGTQQFMSAKTWLSTLIGVDRLFSILAGKFLSLGFLQLNKAASDMDKIVSFSVNDDLDLCLYYMRAFSTVLRLSTGDFWAVLAKRTISGKAKEQQESNDGDNGVSLLVFFLQVCMRCVISEAPAEDNELDGRTTQLCRSALAGLHHILLSPYAVSLAELHLEDILIEKVMRSLTGSDPYVQVLLLDVVFASLKLRETLTDQSLSPTSISEKRPSVDPTRIGQNPGTGDVVGRPPGPPQALLRCIQAGLSSPSSRAVLDSWVSFLGECLPFYSDSIFRVLIPLVETLCGQISSTLSGLQKLFKDAGSLQGGANSGPETTLISLLNALEQVLAKGHDRLMAEEARVSLVKGPEQPQGFFVNIFSSDTPQSRSATANDRLTVLLAFQDAVRMCFRIWSWGQGPDVGTQDLASTASFNYTSLRMRNRARRLLEHLFTAEPLQCMETVVEIWRGSPGAPQQQADVFNLLPALDSSRPKHTIPALFNAIYSRTNPSALDSSRKSTLTVELQDYDVVIFLVEYARSLEDDAMEEIWQDCIVFLKELLGNPFPHRQTLPSLLEFAAILGEKVDNTSFGEQKKMRRELGDLFLRLLTALFTTRPMTFTELSSPEKSRAPEFPQKPAPPKGPYERAEDVVEVLTSIVPSLHKILMESDRVLTAAASISTNVIGPSLRSKSFPDTVTKSTLILLQELARLPNNQKTWKKDVADAFNDPRFFASPLALVQSDWLPLLRQWTLSDKDRMPEIVGRIAPPTTAGIVFGVGATSARLESDRKTQLNLRRIATLILASAADTFVTEVGLILDKMVELLGATATSSPSSTTRAELFMVVRALVLKTSAVHLAPLWPIINAELHAAMSSVATPDHSAASDTYNNASVLQACKLLDLLICVAPDDFQLHEWLFVTDTIDAVHRPGSAHYQPVALVDELSEELGSSGMAGVADLVDVATGERRRPMLGPGGISDEVSLERRDELVAKILRPFFGQLSIYAFESTYAMGPLDWEGCVKGLLKDLFDERSIVRAL
ncbi:hypothetical protein MCOR02_010464 [Pyricularia oryzae]|nr:hypothetical protein MCOR02_010464 [Pyricularia oryzae]KAI6259869.1 hypothetical protein MCOR19_003794 [Pyricularia oryzae]KAI6491847.1 hypothetical protein MCOR18_001918 [Pyricularia oryzae]KAI6510896.1 hypothetical protein MCOR13_000821 [Pyricularia oryzae]KAI6595257.1 hypothetical protein MCOR04_003120 [Pyricularia oryzae]